MFQRFVEWVHSILKRLTTKGVVNKDIVKLEQKFKRLVEQSRQQRAKGESEKSEGEQNQGEYALPDVDKDGSGIYNDMGGESDVEKGTYNNSGRSGKRNSNSQIEVGRIQTDDGREYSQVETNGSIRRSTQMLSNKGNKRVISKEHKDRLKTTAIKNKNGTPKKVYHYTENMEFATFGKGDIGFHFGSKSQAENRGNQLKADGKVRGEGRTIQAFLDIKNPIYIPMDIMNWNAGPLAMRLYGDEIVDSLQFLY